MDRHIKMIWWILITIIFVDIQGRAGANVFLDDDDIYEDLMFTETPATTLKETTLNNKEGHIITKKRQSQRKYKAFSKVTTTTEVYFKQEHKEAISTVTKSTQHYLEIESFKDLMENMKKTDEKNIIIFCSIAGTALLLIIIVSIYIAKAVSRLKHIEKDKLKQAEEGESPDGNESQE